MTSPSPAKTKSSAPELVDPAVIEVLASRICHDLISPVGAMHNGVEFLQEMGAGNAEDAIGLLAHSAQLASAKLQVFRLAYGAGGRDPNIKPADVKKAFAGLIEPDGKIRQEWDAEKIRTDDIPLGFCKILTGVLLLAAESLPKGGAIGVEPDTKGAGYVRVIAFGPDAGARPQVKEALTRALPAEDLDPRLVHPYVLGVLASHYGFSVELAEHGDGRVVYRVS